MTPRAVILEVAVTLLYPCMLMVSFWVLWRGHNEPGGGFIGGLIAACATATLAVARGSGHALRRIPFGPKRLAALSILVALASGLPALFLGRPYLTSQWLHVPLGFEDLLLSTPLLFDIGVYGAVWSALGGLAASLIGIDEERRPC